MAYTVHGVRQQACVVEGLGEKGPLRAALEWLEVAEGELERLACAAALLSGPSLGLVAAGAQSLVGGWEE